MDLIHYAGDTVLTGTEIARALLEYAKALAHEGSSATVDIPSRHSDGSLGRATILVGPASQLISEAVPAIGDELIDEMVVADLRARSVALGQVRAIPVEEEAYSASSIEDFELLDGAEPS